MMYPPIPEFLDRSKAGVINKPRRMRLTSRTRWVTPKLPYDRKPPATKRFRGAERATIHLQDECKAIGSGVRTVWAKVGRTWVHLCDAAGNRGRLRVDVFKRLVRES
jgi:hypothetical protein